MYAKSKSLHFVDISYTKGVQLMGKYLLHAFPAGFYVFFLPGNNVCVCEMANVTAVYCSKNNPLSKA